MKCIVCKAHIDENMGACPRCKFPVLYVIGDGSQPDDSILKLGEEYRRKLLTDIQVSVETYSWKKAEDGYVLNEKKALPLATGLQLLEKGTVWCDTEFARTVSQPRLQLSCVIKSRSGSHTHTLSVDAPTDISFWKLGAQLTDELQLRLLVKSDASCSQSEEISLI